MPPAGIAYGLLAALSFGAGDFVGASAARRAGVIAVVAGAQVAGLGALLVALAVVRPELPAPDTVLLSLAAGLAGAAGLASLFGGMAVGSMGLVAALSGAGSLIPPLAVGALRGQQIAPLQLAGVACAAVAAAAAGLAASQDRVARRALILSAAAAASSGRGTSSSTSPRSQATRSGRSW